ncbi:MAG: ferrous iron transport protein B [Anaerolineaceae bacterium]|jgi:ferrous iron transport protein B
MRFVLIGQPNCGKSTLFNQVAGYKAETGNFIGTTVTWTESRVRLSGEVVDLVDLPGTYTLAGSNPAEQVGFRYLLENEYDCILNVMDASHLKQGLGLTLELLELNKPMILVLNMIDEADHLGIRIDIQGLQDQLKIPVVPMIARIGRGIKPVFLTALRVARVREVGSRVPFSAPVESAISDLCAAFSSTNTPYTETHAIKLLEKDPLIEERIQENHPELLLVLRDQKKTYFNAGALSLALERHQNAELIAERVIKQGVRQRTLRDKLDNLLLHPFWGYVFLIVILYLFFQLVFSFGGMIERPLLAWAENLQMQIIEGLNPRSNVIRDILTGVIQGLSGGLAIVLPYLLPFLIGLSLMEDLGYLPRIAFLMDALMHRVGLHGGAIVPFILGFGCNVPSIMSTRTLEDKKEQFIAAALATMVPCAARLSVVFGLVAFYLGPVIALIIYLFNMLVIAVTGKVLSRIIPEDSPGLILEIPPYRLPTFKAVLQKSWFRVREFIVEAWPVLIAGSIMLALMNSFNLTRFVDWISYPITWLLGLPPKTGMPLVFGVLRKELSLIMLGQALGSMDFRSLLTPAQMITYTVFVIFYMPCLSTLVALHKELGKRAMWSIMGITTLIATGSALIARFVAEVLY